jgi:hypothetical protein
LAKLNQNNQNNQNKTRQQLLFFKGLARHTGVADAEAQLATATTKTANINNLVLSMHSLVLPPAGPLQQGQQPQSSIATTLSAFYCQPTVRSCRLLQLICCL